MSRRERRVAAKSVRTVKEAASLAALVQAGVDPLRAGRFLDAQLCCQQAIAADANRAEALHLKGLLSFHAEQFDAALEWTVRAIRQDPKPQYLFSLGTRRSAVWDASRRLCRRSKRPCGSLKRCRPFSAGRGGGSPPAIAPWSASGSARPANARTAGSRPR
jgi:hypothetical protein